MSDDTPTTEQALREQIADEIEAESEHYAGEQASHWAKVYAAIARGEQA